MNYTFKYTFKLCFRICGVLVKADTDDHVIIICKKEARYVLTIHGQVSVY